MKYLRGYILSQGGRSLLIGRSTNRVKFRPHHRHLTAGGTEVTFRTSSYKFAFSNAKTGASCNFDSRRHVSTTGNGKNQLSAPVALSNSQIRPSLESFITSAPEKARKPFSFLKKDHLRKKRNANALSYGKILSDSNYLSAGASLPILFPGDMIGTAFLPSFQEHENAFDNFLPLKVEGTPEENSLGCFRCGESNAKESQDSPKLIDLRPVEKSTITLGSPSPLSVDKSRSVRKSVRTPTKRTEDALPSLSFDEVHRFGPDKNEDADQKPQVFDYPAGETSSGPFTIHGDRSSVIIHKDLYITNRILDEIKENADIPVEEGSEEIQGDTDIRIPLDVDNELAIDSTVKEAEPAKNDDADGHPVAKDQSASTERNPTPNREQASFSSNPPSSTFEFQNVPVDKLSPAEFLASQSRQNLYKMLENIAPCYLLDGIHVKPLDVTNGKQMDIIKLPKDVEPPFMDEELLNDLPCTFPELMSLLDNSQMRGLPSERDLDEMQISGELEDWFLPLGREIESMLMDIHTEKMLNPEEAGGHLEIGNPIWDPELQNELKEAMNSIGLDGLSLDLPDRETVKTPTEADFLPNELCLEIESSLKPSDGNAFRSGQSSNDRNDSVPPKRKNPNVEVQTETTIRCSRTGDNTNINVVEIQKYLDKRLPYPFATETVLQVFGTNDALQKAAQVVENSKSQLVHLSNATDPNPGMSMPKLQFNHMLSKTHEHGNAKNKKRVLKVKVVPDSSKSTPEIPTTPTPSLARPIDDPQGQNFTKIDKDTLELMRRSKFGNRSVTSKKARRAESLLKLRAKKKSNNELGIVKVLSPKELEKLFPSPPKPKPVEVPRKVIVSNKPSRGQLNAALLKTNAGRIALKIHKKGDDWSLKMKPQSVKPSDSVKVLSGKPVKFGADSKKINDSEASLSTRDRKMLKSIITDKVKDSFETVAQRTVASKSKELQKGIASPQVRKQFLVEKKDLPNKSEPEASNKVLAQKVETKKVEVKADAKPKVVESSQPPPEEAKTDTKKPATSKNTEASPKILKNSPKATPDRNREYVTVSPHNREFSKSAKTEALEVKSDGNRQVKIEDGKVKDDMAVKVSHSSMIASVMKNNDGEPLAPFRLTEPPIEDPLSKKLAKSTKERRDFSEKFAHPEEKDFHSIFGKPKSPPKPKIQEPETPKASSASGQALTISAANVKTRLDGSLFFPFESPVVKELIDSRSSVPNYPELYEADLCKWNKEKRPFLEEFSPIQCKVPLSKLKQFPIHNDSKPSKYSMSQSGVVSISPRSDIVAYKKLASVPAVTRILGSTMTATSQQALDRWKQGLISALGEKGFEEFVQSECHAHSILTLSAYALPSVCNMAYYGRCNFEIEKRTVVSSYK